MRRFSPRWVLLACAAAGLAQSCKSAEEQRAEADREVYQLVLERRAQLSLGESNFTIEPPPESLRQRILRGEPMNPEPLTLVACLDIAAENSREYQQHKEALYLVALDLTLERWKLGLQRTGILTGTVERNADGTTDARGSADLALTRLLGSGAQIVGGIGLGLARSLSFSDGWNPVTDVGLAVTQPLLRGFGSRIVEEPLTQAERDLVYEVRAFERYRRTFAVDVAQRFYRLLQSMDAVANQESNVENLTQLSARNDALEQAGRLSDIEAGQARQNELRSTNSLLLERERLEAQRDNFKLFLGLPIDTELVLDPHTLSSLENQEMPDLALDEGRAVALALSSRLDYLTVQDIVEDRSRQVYVTRDALRAALNVAGSVNFHSDPDTPLNFDLDDTTWLSNVTLEMPWNRLPQRNDYRQAIIAHQSAVRSEEQAADEIRASLRDDQRALATRRETYQIQLNAVALADERIASTRLKLDAGRADTRDLLEAEASLLEAKNAATATLIDFVLARLDLYLDLELLRVDERGIWVDEAALRADVAP